MKRRHYLKNPDTGLWNVMDGDQVIATGVTWERIIDAEAQILATAAPLTAAGTIPPPPEGGTEWYAVVGFSGAETDDGRLFPDITWRTLPLPLMCQFQNLGGHEGAYVVGRCDELKLDGNRVLGKGWYDNSEDAAVAIKQNRERTNYGISMDLASKTWPEYECTEYDDGGHCVQERTVYEGAVICGMTQVTMPAFGAAIMSLDDYPTTTAPDAPPAAEPPPMEDSDFPWWLYFGAETLTAEQGHEDGKPCCESCGTKAKAARTSTTAAQAAQVRAADAGQAIIVASAISAPADPPAAWFDNPELSAPTPLTVTDDGRIFGHVADWSTCHTGSQSKCVTAPHSLTNYAYFRTGVARTAEGTDIPVGALTLTTEHAPVQKGLTWAARKEHYENTGNMIGALAAGEDEHGIWVAGALRPDVTAGELWELRMAGCSGDWQMVGGNKEMIAVLGVNWQGFPITRALTASGALAQEPEEVEVLTGLPAPTPATMTASDTLARLAQIEMTQAQHDRILSGLLSTAAEGIIAQVQPRG